MSLNVVVLGRFPPPLDGQTIATNRVADLLLTRYRVVRVNTEPPQSEFVENNVSFRPKRVRHYWRLRQMIREELARNPTERVLWASISPAVLGHWRDILTVAPFFQSGQRVYGVVHRAMFDRLFQSPATRATARGLVRRLSGFVFLNEILSEACAEWIPAAKRHIIPNTIDELLHFSEDQVLRKRDERRGRHRLRLLFLSNLIPLKGYLDVLQATAILKKHSVPFEMHFAGRWGSEDDRRHFESIVTSENLAQTVTLHGGITDRSQVRALYEQTDVFILPSYHPTEAQPLALIEAINAGIPVVTTDHGGIPFVVRDGLEGLHVPPRAPQAIADAVSCLRDYNLWARLSYGARERFDEVFAPHVVRAQWETLLRNAG